MRYDWRFWFDTVTRWAGLAFLWWTHGAATAVAVWLVDASFGAWPDRKVF